MTIDSDLRLGQVDENRFVRAEARFLYKQKIGKYFTVEPRYRHLIEQLFSGASMTENRLSVNGKVQFSNIEAFSSYSAKGFFLFWIVDKKPKFRQIVYN